MIKRSFAFCKLKSYIEVLNYLIYHSNKHKQRFLLSRFYFYSRNFFKFSSTNAVSKLKFVIILIRPKKKFKFFFYLSKRIHMLLRRIRLRKKWNLKTKFKKDFKNITLFLNKILFFNILNFINFYTKFNKKFFFVNLYTRFFLTQFYFFRLIKKKFLFMSIENKFKRMYSKFKIFNFFKRTFLKRFSSVKNTYIDLFFLNRNFLISFYNYFFSKFWSIGLFLKLLKLKYKIKNQIRYIKAFFFKVKLNFTKYIILFLNKISIRFDLFLKNLLFLINNLNKRVYKRKYLRLDKVIVKLKFKIFEKKSKKKPRKKKYIIKKLKTYMF